jgi:PAS domain S-box-containing protein
MAGPGQCGFRLPPEPAIASTGPAPPSIHTTQAGVHEKGLDASLAKDWLYAFAIQSLDYALLAVDADQRILWANPGAGWILAATQSEIVGSQIAQFFTPEDRVVGIPEHEQRSALRQGSSDDDRWMLRADGSRFWASGKTIALSRNDGVPMGFFKIFRDQTEVKMRTDALAQDDAARLPADSEPAAAPAERVSLQAAVHGAIALAGAEVGVGHRRIEVLFPAGAPIETRGDRGQLQQAFAALIGHALRATADDGHVWINGTTEGELATVRVEDNGRGLTGERLAEIYDLFTSPALEPLEPGTAGELATARAIVDAHGGTVQARSAGPGKGSEFVVTLPLARD